MITVNRGFERIFGYSEAEALGRSSFDLGMWWTTPSGTGW